MGLQIDDSSAVVVSPSGRAAHLGQPFGFVERRQLDWHQAGAAQDEDVGAHSIPTETVRDLRDRAHSRNHWRIRSMATPDSVELAADADSGDLERSIRSFVSGNSRWSTGS
jgi:hypothetical protein